jgi:hypothetical protein
MINSVESCWSAAVYSHFIELVDAKKYKSQKFSVIMTNIVQQRTKGSVPLTTTTGAPRE